MPFGVRPHARPESISKRAPSATRTSTPTYHAVARVAAGRTMHSLDVANGASDVTMEGKDQFDVAVRHDEPAMVCHRQRISGTEWGQPGSA